MSEEEFPAARFRAHGQEYVVRRFHPDDVDAVLSLYADALGGAFSHEWFEWKYVENHYTEEVDVYVADADGSVVGACGFLSIPIHTGRRTVRAIQPCDAAVDRSHRRRGVYSQILGSCLDQYAAAGVEFTIDFPNESTKGAFEQFGWRLVAERPTCYRIQRPIAQLGLRLDGRRNQVVHEVGATVARGYLGLRRRSGPATPTDVSVERHEDVAAEALATIYERAVPDAFHATRTAEFYRWRFRNPRWRYASYVGYRGREPAAGVVIGTKTIAEVRTAKIADVVPLAAEPDREAALNAVLDMALADLQDADVVVAPGTVIPRPVRRKYGFMDDRQFPLSRTTTRTVQGTYLLGGESETMWRVDGKELTDPANWCVTFAECDTG